MRSGQRAGSRAPSLPESIQQRARRFPCRRDHGGCGARPGEFCVTWRGKKSYTAHLDRLEQENDAYWARVGLAWPAGDSS